MQSRIANEWIGVESEDCLYLNVIAPANPVANGTVGLLPVLLYLFGGGDIVGGASSSEHHAWFQCGGEGEGIDHVRYQRDDL